MFLEVNERLNNFTYNTNEWPKTKPVFGYLLRKIKSQSATSSSCKQFAKDIWEPLGQV